MVPKDHAHGLRKVYPWSPHEAWSPRAECIAPCMTRVMPMTRRSAGQRAGRQSPRANAASASRRPLPRPARRAGRQEKPPASGASAPRLGHRDTPAESSRVSIVVADNQAIDRAGIVGLLETQRSFEIVGESGTIEECIEQCRVLEPDVLVLTLNLPAQDRKAAIPAIRARLPGLRILALSAPGGRRLFSEREAQVAALIAEAHSNKEIASLLGIREPP